MPSGVDGFISNLNYYSRNGANENITFIGAKTSFYKTSVQVGGGVDINTNATNNTTYQPILEIKGNHDLGGGFSVQGRFRNVLGNGEKPNTHQYRAVITKSFKTDIDGLSFYISGHATAKHNNIGWNSNVGGWLGASYTNGRISAFVEAQQNLVPNQAKTFNNPGNQLINTGITINLP